MPKTKPMTTKAGRTIYVLSPKIKWATFKLLQKKLVQDSGPAPIHGDRILWEMLRDEQIYLWFDPVKLSWDMGIGLKLPKANYLIIDSPKELNA